MNTDFATASIFKKAACRKTEDKDIFFPSGAHKKRELEEKVAKYICNSCKINQECLDWAISTNQEHGILGGMTSAERATHKRRLSRKTRRRAA